MKRIKRVTFESNRRGGPRNRLKRRLVTVPVVPFSHAEMWAIISAVLFQKYNKSKLVQIGRDTNKAP